MRVELQQRQVQRKEESSLPLLIGLLSLMGLGYVLGMPAVAAHLPSSMERPFMRFHEETNKVIDSSRRSLGF